MDRRLPSFSYVQVVICLLVLSFYWGEAAAQCVYNPTVTHCNSQVPSLLVDLTSDPSATWSSCSISRGTKYDTCCGNPQVDLNDRCIEFMLLLHPDAVGIIFDITAGAIPSNIEYDIDCGGVQDVGDVICINNTGAPIFITFCEPGNNPNVYSVTSIAGFAQGAPEVTVEGCDATLSVTGVYYEPSITWSSTQDPAYDAFLSCSSGCSSTNVSVPNDPTLPDTLIYEVCADVSSNCGGIFAPVCTEVKLAVLSPPEASIPDYTFCPDKPYTVDVTPIGTGNYEYTFFDGPSATGSIVCAQSASQMCTYATPGSKSVRVVDLDLLGYGSCAYTVVNFDINLFANPPADITGPSLICVGVQYTFSTPFVSGATYDWDFGSGANASGTDGRTETVTYNTCGDKTITLVVTSSDNCDSTVVITIPGDATAPDLSGCTLPEPTVECGGTAQNEANITAWHNANLTTLQNSTGCVSDDCPWTVTSDFNLGNYTPDPTCGAGTTAGVITVTYTVDDGCQQSTISATYTITDMTPPVVNDPDLDDMSFECVGSIPSPETNITVIEDCGSVSFVHLGDTPSGDPCNLTIVRAYELTDACGNVTNFFQSFTINDVSDPTISCPANVTGEGCSTADVLSISGLAFSTSSVTITEATFEALDASSDAFDNCGIEEVQYIDSRSDSPCEIAITRTFTVIDSCGNTATCQQIITVENTQAPTITNCPNDMTVTCYSDLVNQISQDSAQLVNGGVTTGCGIPYTISVSPMPSFDNCPAAYTITYTVLDSCGRSTSCSVEYDIVNAGPSIGYCPAGGVVACYSDLVSVVTVDSFLIASSITTSCGMSFSFTRSALPAYDNCPGTYTITYEVTDSCGRTANCAVTYSVSNSGPLINACPANTTINCYSDFVAQVTADSLALAAGGVTTACGMSYVVTRSALPAIDDCPGAYVITWTATDSCGRMDQCNTTYTISNNAPTITCLADTTVTCYEAIQAIVDANVLSHNGGTNVAVSCDLAWNVAAVVAPKIDNCTPSYKVDYTITDQCGRTDVCTQTLTIDNPAPTITCFADTTVTCYEDIQAIVDANVLSHNGGTNVTVSCDLTWNVVALVTPKIDNCTPTYTVDYTITDQCGRTDQCTQTFTIDNADPTITCFADTTVTCYEDIQAIVDANVTSHNGGSNVTVSCDLTWNVVAVVEPKIDNCTPTYTVDYTITDQCGRTDQCTQTFTIDNADPTITCFADTTVTCYEDIQAIVDANVLSHNGGSNVTVSCDLTWNVVAVVAPKIDNCTPSYTVDYTITDQCGRTDQCTQTFTIDNPAPTITCFADTTVTCYEAIQAIVDANVLSHNGGTNVAVSCDLTWNVAAVVAPKIDNCTPSYTVDYTITDQCGRTDQCTQTFTIDNADPTITCFADTTVTCYEDIQAIVDANVISHNSGTNVTVNCDLTWNVVGVVAPKVDNCTPTYKVDYTITDQCGRTDQCTQTFTIDNADPTITCFADTTVTCYEDIQAIVDANVLSHNGGSNVTVSCDLTWNVVAVVAPKIDNCTPTYTVDYTITDQCGRTDVCTQTFAIDNADPTITCFADTTVTCYEDIQAIVDANVLSHNGGSNVTVSCDLTWNVVAVVAPKIDNCTPSYTVDYTITDQCGRTDVCIQTFTIDNPAPTITCFADTTVTCYEDIQAIVDANVLSHNGGSNVTVSCDLTWNVVAVVAPKIDNCTPTYTVDYTITDQCGRTDVCTQTFTIDNPAPTITCFADTTVTCYEDIQAIVDANVISHNGGSNVTVSCDLTWNVVAVVAPKIDNCTPTYTVDYAITDQCGRTDVCTQTFTIDNPAPTITCFADTTVTCYEDIQAIVDANVISHNGGSNVTVSCDLTWNVVAVVAPKIDNCTPTYTVDYTITDQCGRTDQCTQTFTIDNADPTITCFADTTVTCYEDIQAIVDANVLSHNGGSNVTVSCDLTWNVVAVLTPKIDNCTPTYTVDYTITDQCGRTDQCTQTFTIDNADPTITCFADTTVTCYEDIQAIVDANVLSHNSGTNVTVSCDLTWNVVAVVAPKIDNCTPSYTVDYTITDQCGRTDQCTQTFTIDNADPTITCFADTTVTCYEDIQAIVDANVISHNGGSNVTVSCDLTWNVAAVLAPKIDNCTPTYTVDYTITDQCGRTDVCTQTFTIDNADPTITCFADTTVTCYEDIQAIVDANVTGHNGGSNVTVSCDLTWNVVAAVAPKIDNCTPTYTVDYTITDQCGRTDQCTQTFTIDNADPTITCFADTTVTCYEDIQAIVDANVISHNGGSNVIVSCDLTWNVVAVVAPKIDNCTPTYSVDYTITDQCGRTDQCTQTFTIDNPGPSITCPTGGTVPCYDDLVAIISLDSAILTVSGVTVACDLSYSISVSPLPPRDDCPHMVTITYTVLDQCGRMNSCDVDYMIDNPAPTITCFADTTVTCYEDIQAIVDANVLSHNGGSNVTVSCDLTWNVVAVVAPKIDNCTPTYTVDYTITDQCGRTDVCTQTFTIDNADPTITCFADTTVTCYEDIQAIVDANVLSHNGGSNVTVSCDLTWNVVAVVAPKIDNCTPTYTVDYTITDQCGRTDVCTQTFTIDNADPTITCFADTTVTCYEDIQAIVDANVLSYNGGSNVTVSCDLTWNVVAVVAPKIDNCTPTYTVDYTITDQCGRTDQCTQTFAIDNADPTITCFADTTVTCYEDIQAIVDANVLSHNAGTNVTVSCDLTWNVVAVVAPKIDNCTPSYTVDYTITDQCGRTDQCIQTFTIDNAAPTITCFADTTVTCYEDIQAIVDANVLSHNAGTNVTVSCDLTWNVVAVVAPKIDNCTPTYTVDYTITDQCGRTDQCTQTFAIDNADPTITCFADTTVTCYEDIQAIVDANVLSHIGGSNVTVSCDLTWNVVAVVAPKIDNCTPTYTVDYTITDQCGRTDQCTQTFTIDNAAPTITCFADTTVTCYEDIQAIVDANVISHNSGSNVIVSCDLTWNVVAVVAPKIDNCTPTYTVDYTITDQCGRTDVCTQTFTIDNPAPTITCFADTTVTCYEDIQAIVDANVISHNSGSNVTVSCDLTWNVVAVLAPKIDNCTPSYTVDYTITDQCGRADVCTQTFTIDNPAPTITCFADTTVTCYEDIQAIVDANVLSHNAGTNVTVSCDLTWNVVAVVAPKIDNCTPTYTVDYTITDQCGRTDQCTQTFTIDNAAPTITCFADTTVTCYEDIQAIVDANVLSHNGGSDATVSCDLTWNVVAVVAPKIDNCTPSYTVDYTITDQCGRTDECTQTFTIDNPAPTITCFADTTVTCYEDIQAIVDANVLSHNAGTNVTVSCDLTWNVVAAVTPKIDNCTPTYTVDYTITDQCGRTDACTQTFTIDNPAPTITCFADTTVTCYEDIQAIVDANVLSHNGGSNVTVSCDLTWNVVAVVASRIDNCTPTYTVDYTITDQCGRTDQCTQTFTIDNAVPTITCFADTTVTCYEDIQAIVDANVVSHNAGTNVAVSCDLTWNVVAVVAPKIDNCTPTYTVDYTITDQCGRTDQCTQTFTIDNAVPTITCFADTTVTCYEDIQAIVDANVLSHNGGTNVAVSCDLTWNVVAVVAPKIDNCTPTYTVDYTITDQCGRTDVCIQTFTIDNGGPAIACPSGGVVSCYQDLISIVAIDSAIIRATGITVSCDLSFDVAVSSLPAPTDCPQTVTVTYIVMDQCGRADSCAVDYQIDNAGPTITCPADIAVDCHNSTDTTVTGSATATASCLLAVAVSFVDNIVSTGCSGNYSIERLWIAQDDCGRADSCLQIITVQDTTLPVIVCPADVLIDCHGSTDTTATGVATASDNCGPAPAISYLDNVIPTGCGGNYVIERTWTAIDECGNVTNCLQTITVQDTSLPVITCPADVLIDCHGSTDTTATGVATATDNCGPLPAISYLDNILPAGCGGNYVIERTWTAVDECGNSSTCLQTITVQDTSLPVITCPADVLIDCHGSTDTTATGVATATDNCGPTPVISYLDNVIATGCGGNYVIERTWTAVDECGNSSNCLQTITVQDTSLPVITCPADVLIDCHGSTDTTATGVATATDNCGPVPTISFADNLLPTGCGGNYVIERTWTAVDECGNSSTCLQTITVQDTSLPVITCPADVLIDCHGSTDTTATGVATATDNCGPAPAISYIDNQIPTGCGGNYVIERTWTAVDECGNSSSCLQTITVQDTSLPVITCPSDVLIDCHGSTDTTATGVATATDNCGPAPSVSFLDNVIPMGCGGNYVIERTWTAVDECGNSSSCLQTITVQDTSLPVIICPADVLIDCHGSTDTTATGVATATDNCGPTPAISYIDNQIPTGCGGNYVIERTWTAVDECGNSSSCLQTITVQDTSLPVITCPADVLIDCHGSTDTTATGVATATDNCGPEPTISFADNVIATGCGGNYVIERTWTAVDECGNSSTCLQTITVQDTSLPVITCPADVLIDCHGSTDTTATGVATATDNCGPTPTISFLDNTIATGCGGNYVIERTWTAVDECGNSSSCLQTITVQDTSLPVITCPADVLIDCHGSTDTTATGVATATDNCGPVPTVSFLDNVIPTGCGGNYVIERTWTAVDECGNSSTCLQTITVQDTSLPVITCPADVLIDCHGSTDTTATGVATATDNCGPAPVISYVDNQITTGCGGNYVIERTWTAVDECGNSSSCLQTITVQDTSLPVITCPADVLIDCHGSTDTTATGVATATDNCGPAPAISYIDNQVPTGCGGNYVIERTWTAVDECGNSSSCLQTITVQDTSLPVITCPTDVLIDCHGSTDTTTTGVATATDNCGPVPTVSFLDNVIPMGCGGNYVIERTWTAVDECGNSSTCLQTITVQDTSLPVITCPADVLIDCHGSTDTTATGVATATDNCGPAPVISYVDNQITTGCGGNYVIERTWTAMDECGNSSTCLQTITVQDTSLPVITCPADVLIDCHGSTDTTATGVATATDNCGPAPVISYVDNQITTGCGGNYVIERTWTAVDECGNSSTCLQTITVQDTSLPVITCPADVLIDCHGSTDTTATGVATATDNCGPEPTISFVDNVISTACGGNYVIERTWTAVDECGNSSTCLQTITVQDTSLPVIICPADATVNCDESADTSLVGVATATDNCGPDPVITFVDDTIPGPCGGSYQINRTWTAMDECLNSSSCIQVITVQDTVLPIISNVPNDTTVSCLSVPSPPVTGLDIVGTDNCGSLSVSFTEDTLAGICENSYILVRTWTAVDNCGNTRQESQTITVESCAPMVTASVAPNPACQGDDVTFNATVVGNYANPVYRWQMLFSGSWVDIPGADMVPFILTDVDLSDAGSYRLVVADQIVNLANSACNATSDTLQLVVNPPTTGVLDIEICDGETYDFNGTPVSLAGSYVDTLVAATGCDSILTLNLSVLAVLQTDLTDTICDHLLPYAFTGGQVPAAGFYTDTLQSQTGCDSIVTLTLTVFPTQYETIADTICEGQVYDFHGSPLIAAGTYVDTVTSSQGCDSVVTLELIVNPVTFETVNQEICQGEIFMFNGTALDSSGTYSATLTNVWNCDSVVTLNLTVHPAYAQTMDVQICDGTMYDFHGLMLSDSGTYVDTLPTIHGCDSVITLNLAVLDILETYLSDSICAGESYDFNGQILTATGTAVDTLVSSIGCDSIVTMDLTVLPVQAETIAEEICADEIYDFHGQSLNASGTYVDTVVGSNGCDSIVTLNLLVHPLASTTLDAEICEGSVYDFHGNLVDTTGSYVDTLSTIHGCDSVVTLNLTVHPAYAQTMDVQICDGTLYDFHGLMLSDSGTYVDTLPTIHGCDSVITLNLAVLDILETYLSDSICAGESYDFNGQILTATGTAVDTLVSSIGCDSIVTMDLTVLPVQAETIDEEICADEIYDFHGQSLNASGTYVDTVVGSNGCDSIVTLNLLVHPLASTTLDAEICEGSVYDFHGNLVDTTGSYVDTLSTIHGCDSVVTLNLTVHPAYAQTVDVQICEGTLYDFHGLMLSDSGTYVDTLPTILGCDSVITLNLAVLDILETYLSDSICAGESYDFNGQTLTATGTAVDTLVSSIGCDSIVTMDLTVLPVQAETIDEEICADEIYDFHGQSLNASGTYVDTVVGSNGCDSIVTLNLVVHPLASTTLDAEICEGSVYDFHGNLVDTTGSYVDTLSTIHGCDSVVTLNLTVHPAYTETITAQICDGTLYDFHGLMLSDSGTYVDTLPTIHGCDSVITLNLAVLDILETYLSDSICAGESYDFNGQILTATGTAVDTLVSSIGCDSIVTMDLTVLPVQAETIEEEICADEIYDFHGQSLNASGTYVDTVVGSNGCDSIVTLNLVVHPLASTTLDAEICEGSVYDFHGNLVDTTGSYVDTLSTIHGCDSVVTSNLTVHPAYAETITAQICDGTLYDFHGLMLSDSGTYVDTLPTIHGCDSVITLNLAVLDILETYLSDSICAGESYDFNGQILTATGTAVDTLVSSIGCDSIVTMDLTVLPVQAETIEEEICADEIYDFHGQSLNASGTYVDTVVGSNGCDSIVTLNLVVHPLASTTLDAEICEGSVYDFHGNLVDTTGSYVDTLSTIHGCDSVVTSNLTVHPAYAETITAQICDGTLYDFHGLMLSDSGTYVDTLPTIHGCDSVITLNLEVLEILETFLSDSICAGESYDFNGQMLTATGTAVDTLVSSIGCDSIVTMDLTVLPVQAETIDEEICADEIYDFHGQSLNASGTYVDTVVGSNGCDSIVTLNLLVHPLAYTTLDAEICEGSVYDFHGNLVDTTGSYVDTLSTIHGCDSVVTLNLTVHPAYAETITAQICDGTLYDFHGLMLSDSGTYVDTLPTIHGCDSVITLHLEVLEILETFLSDSICAGESYDFNGQILMATGTAVDTLVSSIGCDSIVTMDLTVLPVQAETIDEEICADEIYDFHGQSLNASGTYVDTVVGSNGCDSIVTLNLLVHPLASTTLDAEICEGSVYDFHGNLVDTTGSYVDTLSTIHGCDSVVTLNLTVHPAYAETITAQICDGTLYDFHGLMLSDSGTYVDTLPTIHGCDSVITLNLAVLDILETYLSDSICAGESYDFNGQMLTATGTAVDTLVSSIGCDSIVTMDLTVLPVQAETIDEEICADEIYDFHGQSLNASGTYVDTVVGSNGCDSIVTLNLVVHPLASTTLDAEICEGSVYDFHGNLVDTTGSYVDTLSTIHGCDSVVTLNLTVHPAYAQTMDVQICDGTLYDFHGLMLSDSGTYVDTLPTIHGCDSVITLHLEVLEILETFLSDSICAGESYDFNGQILMATGTAVDTLVSSIGCDSIVTMDLTVLPVQAETIDEEICADEIYDFHGQSLNASGTYVDTVVGSNGCDSIVTLNLLVHPLASTTLDEEICEGSVYDFHGNLVDTTGSYVDTLSTIHGCDSVVTLNLTVHPAYAETITAQICDGTLYDFHGLMLSDSGTYVDTLPTIHGCDSVITLNLEVLEILETFLSDSICAGESYDFNGQMLTATGTAVDTLVSSIGCDSIVTMDLTVLPTTSETISAEICVGESYDFHGQQLTTSGVYNATVVGSNGCDSVVTLQFTVHPTQSTFLSAEICEGSTYDFHGVALDSTGTYIDTLSTAHGCDSIVSLNLTVYPTYAETQVAQICEGSTHDFHGVALDSSGIYVDTLSTVNGCDSVVTLTLTVLDVLEETITDTICAGEVYDFNGVQVSTGGLYMDTTTSSIGCDSIVTLDLTVLPTTSETTRQRSV